MEHPRLQTRAPPPPPPPPPPGYRQFPIPKKELYYCTPGLIIALIIQKSVHSHLIEFGWLMCFRQAVQLFFHSQSHFLASLHLHGDYIVALYPRSLSVETAGYEARRINTVACL